MSLPQTVPAVPAGGHKNLYVFPISGLKLTTDVPHEIGVTSSDPSEFELDSSGDDSVVEDGEGVMLAVGFGVIGGEVLPTDGRVPLADSLPRR